MAPLHVAESGVLLVGLEEVAASGIVQSLQNAKLRSEWVGTLDELSSRTDQREAAAPWLVVLDLELRGATTEELVVLTQQKFPNAWVIAVTGVSSRKDADRLQELGIPWLTKPLCVWALTELALRIFSSVGPQPRQETSTRTRERTWSGVHVRYSATLSFQSMFDAYAASRSLSAQQTQILHLYLEGKNDKEIATTCGCQEATVYEHWRRMAKKVGVAYKADVVADFHRFLAARSEVDRVRSK